MTKPGFGKQVILFSKTSLSAQNFDDFMMEKFILFNFEVDRSRSNESALVGTSLDA